MNDFDSLRRWLNDEESRRDDAADLALARLFSIVGRIEPSAGFVHGTAVRIERAKMHSRRLSSLAWAAVAVAAVGGLVESYALAVPVGTWAIKSCASTVSFTATWLVAYATVAVNLWSFIVRIGGHVTTALAAPPNAAWLVATEVVGVLAFFTLQRLIRFENRGVRV